MLVTVKFESRFDERWLLGKSYEVACRAAWQNFKQSRQSSGGAAERGCVCSGRREDGRRRPCLDYDGSVMSILGPLERSGGGPGGR